MDGVADTVEHQLTLLLPEQGGQPRNFRFQTKLPSRLGAMDNASPEHIAALKQQAEQLIEVSSPDIDQLCVLLTATS